MNRLKASFQLAFGLMLVAIAVVIAGESIRFSLPMVRKGVATMYDAPGLVPIIGCIMLLILAILFSVNAAREGGSLRALFSTAAGAAFGGGEARIVYLVLGLLIAYRIVFTMVPYLVSTTAFLLIFYYALGSLSVRSGLVAVISSGVFFSVFRLIFNISLP